MNRHERFIAKVNVHPGDACWNWAGSRTGSGYGQFWDGTRNIPAHWFLLETRPQQGEQACHRCDNKLCVRPSHIFIGTPTDNERDKVSKGRHNTAPGCRAMLRVRRVNRGQNNHESKLTEAQAIEAKNCPRTRGAATAMARRFGVSLTVICDIRDGKRWTHLQP
jgi:hypothetical protein